MGSLLKKFLIGKVTSIFMMQKQIPKNKKLFFASFVIMLSSSTLFGLGFKIKQISIASHEIIKFYPLTWYAVSALKSLFIFGVLWLGLTSICIAIDQRKNAIVENLFNCSLPFTAFMLSAYNIDLSGQVRLFSLFVVLLLILKIFKNKSFFLKIKEPLAVLIIFIITYMFMLPSFSPLYHASFFDSWGRIDYLMNFEHQWENAKAYDFLGNFSQKGRLGGYTQAQFLVSELSSLIVLLFDIPLVDLLTKWASIKFMYFGLFIFGSFGCYLFLRYGLRLSFLPSFIGGLGYIFGNTSFLLFFSYNYANHYPVFIFFPWVLLFLKSAYSSSSNKLSLVCLAGLIASLAEYTTSSHPEIQVLFIFFCNSYNIYLAFVQFKNDRFELKAIARFFKYTTLFPIFHLVGLSYRLVPLSYAIFTKEFALYDSAPTGPGLWWPGFLENYFHLFFRFEDDTKIGSWLWYQVAEGGLITPYYTGQFVMLMIFSFICSFLAYACRRYFKKGETYSQNLQPENSLFFLSMFLFLALNLPMGGNSLLAKLLQATGFMRVHELPRLTMFYSFFALVTAMCGLDNILGLRKMFNFNRTFFVYILTLLLVYFTFTLAPARYDHSKRLIGILPDGILMDGVILLAIYFLIFLLVKSHVLFKSKRLTTGFQYGISIMFTAVAFYSFLTINKICYQFVTETKNESLRKGFREDKVFTSLRTAVTQLRNNQHDRASFEYLDRRLNKFKDDIDSRKRREVGLCFDKILSEEYCNEAREYYYKINNILEKNTNRLRLFEALAPEIDNYYLFDGPSLVMINAPVMDWGPLTLNIYNTLQFYLPDRYQLFLYSTKGEGGMLTISPVGKNSELEGGLFYGLQGAYPAIDVNFYFKALYPPLRISEIIFDYNYYGSEIIFDYNYKGIGLDYIISNKNEKKLFNIIGLDYIIFHKYYLNGLPSPSDTLDSLKSLGFVPIELPESFTFSPRFDKNLKMYVLQNPQSYGKAYIAKWARMIKPEENWMNLDFFHLPRHWPRSEALLNNFEQNIAKIPDGIWRSVIIESSDAKDYSNNPYINEANNSVNIIKIIGSKAVFAVDCREDNCWFVYNTAALKGWKAFSGSNQVPIHKANLGFIGVKLNKGKHFLWMEYKPFSGDIGLFVTLLGWLLIVSLQISEFVRNYMPVR